ncbi:hypothetical protein CLD22_24430, partial [Rubrivivax gelatinosus]|nr:hypothetical protein [Rubrivivax gelatinosus]
MGGSSKKQTTGYRYLMGVMMVLCRGPVDKVIKLIAGERDAWVGPQTDSGAIEINAPELFGGDKREGGIQGVAEILMGKSSQTLSSWARGLLPTPHVGYRGVVSVLYDGLVSSNSPYMKTWAWQVERTISGWAGDDCWYPEKAPIELGPISVQQTAAPAFVGVAAAGGGGLISVPDHQSGDLLILFTKRSSASVASYPDALPGWTTPAGGTWIAGTVAVAYRLQWRIATAEAPIASIGVGLNNVSACFVYRDLIVGPEIATVPYAAAFTVLAPALSRSDVSVDPWWLCIGTSTLSAISTGAETHRYTQPNLGGGSVFAVDTDGAESESPHVLFSTAESSYGTAATVELLPVSRLVDVVCNAANPAHIVYECLTSTEWGEGWPRAMIGPTFAQTADTLFAEGFGLCYLYSPGDTWEFIQEVCSTCGAVVYQDPRTGLFEMRLLRADYVAADMPLFETTADQVDSFQRATYGDLVNEVTVVYRDWSTNEDQAVTVRNGACIAAQGGVITEKVTYTGIPTAELAARVGQRDVLLKSTPLAKATIRVGRAAWSLVPGSVIRWRYAAEGIDGTPFRVLDIDRGELASGTITLVIAEDYFGLSASSYIGVEPSAWEEPDRTASPPARQDLVEVPYRSLVSEMTAAELEAIDPDAAYFAAVAGRPSSIALSAEIWSRSAGAEFQSYGAGAFVPAAELLEAVGQASIVLHLAGATDLDEVEPDSLAIVGTGPSAEWV